MAVKVAAARSHRLVHDADGLNTAMWPVPANDPITPTQGFFTRSHAPIPRLDPHTWRLQVDGLVGRAASFSLVELRRTFPQRHVTATLVCAGLRRNEFLGMGPLPGELPWGPEPASTGRWTGVSLGDVLRLVGITEKARHVELVGLDQVERHGRLFGFGGSIDLSKALGNEVLLASELNGSPLPPEHGFPLRAVVPGWIGARSVKWLGRITLLDKPSGNYFQSQAYRTQREISPRDPRDVSRGTPLSEVPLNSVILRPTTADAMPAGETRVCGWAMGSGGRALTAVEVSPNDGKDWTEARIVVPGAGWAWSLWEAMLELPRGRHTLVVRATDTGGVAQPPSIEATWNVKGYNNNAWHRVTIDLA
jgi:sulfite oxidase